MRPRPDAARRLRGRAVHQRVRRHLAEPVPTLLLRALLLAGQRGGVPRPPEGRRALGVPPPPHERRPPDRPVRQDAAAGDRPPGRGRVPQAIAPFAELERSPEHIHTYRLTPLGLWNARAAGHDAEQVVDTLLSYSRYAVPHALLVDIAETMSRFGRLRLEKHPVHGLVLVSNDRPVLEEVLRAKKIAGHARRAPRRRHRGGARLRARQPQAGAAQAGLAGRGLRRVRRRRGAPDRARRERLEAARPTRREAAEAFWHGGSGVVVLPCGAGKTLVGAAAMAPRPGDHADPGHQHRPRAPVEGRAGQAHLADRRRDRRVLRLRQGGPAGHHRDVPGADHPPEGRLHPPRAARRPRLGPDRVRRGAPAAGADLPDDRRPPGPPPDRPDRDAGARGRPRGRRVLADRPEALRRALEGHRVAGLHRAGRLRRGAGDAARQRAARLRDRGAGGALPAGLLHPPQDRRGQAAGQAARRAADAGDRPVHRPARRARPPPSTPR